MQHQYSVNHELTSVTATPLVIMMAHRLPYEAQPHGETLFAMFCSKSLLNPFMTLSIWSQQISTCWFFVAQK